MKLCRRLGGRALRRPAAGRQRSWSAVFERFFHLTVHPLLGTRPATCASSCLVEFPAFLVGERFALGLQLARVSSSVRCSMPMKALCEALARINSSSFACSAVPSRFCVFWMRNTMRNVTMVVPVLMTSCHVSEKPKIGPLNPQTITIAQQRMKVIGRPAACAIVVAKWVKSFELLETVAMEDLVEGRAQGNSGRLPRGSGLLIADAAAAGVSCSARQDALQESRGRAPARPVRCRAGCLARYATRPESPPPRAPRRPKRPPSPGSGRRGRRGSGAPAASAPRRPSAPPDRRAGRNNPGCRRVFGVSAGRHAAPAWCPG